MAFMILRNKYQEPEGGNSSNRGAIKWNRKVIYRELPELGVRNPEGVWGWPGRKGMT